MSKVESLQRRRRIVAYAWLVATGVLGCALHDDRLTPGIFLEPESKAVLPPGVEVRRASDEGLALTKL